MTKDVNTHNPVWNLYCYRRQNAAIWKDLIEQFGLLVNNKPGYATRPLSREVSVINLVFFFSPAKNNWPYRKFWKNINHILNMSLHYYGGMI